MSDISLRERCIQLYDKHWSSRKQEEKDKFRDYLRSSEVPIELITYELSEAEEYVLKGLREFPLAKCHKASDVLYNQHPEMFSGKKVLEIGSGRHINKKLVELSECYHGIDPYYEIIPFQRAIQDIDGVDSFRMIKSAIAWSGKMLSRLKDKGLRDDFAYDFDSLIDSLIYTKKEDSDVGLIEYRSESGAVRLMSGGHNQVSLTYDVVINGGAQIDQYEVPEIKLLLANSGIFVLMGTPDMPIWKEELTTKYFTNQSEIWVELKGEKSGGVYTAFIGKEV
jgi:hypothetical protein